MSNTASVLLLPHIQVQNANAISGPMSWGFPSPTAFTGFVHALERKLRHQMDISFGGVGIICHRFEPQIYKPTNGDQTFRLTRNPFNAGWKSYKEAAAAIVEEGRAHLEVSLLIQVTNEVDDDDKEELLETLLYTMRIAGGSILSSKKPVWIDWFDAEEDNVKPFRKLRRKLLPGFALVLREDLLQKHIAELQESTPEKPVDSLEALLDFIRIQSSAVGPDPKDEEQTLWERDKKPETGWFVPVPVGYAAISPLYEPGLVLRARDEQTPFRFVESLYSLGAWVSPHRVDKLEKLLWHAETEAEGVYKCHNQWEDKE
ncbi:CRISPR-associated protein Csy2 [Gammaproteobacteria bacterium]